MNVFIDYMAHSDLHYSFHSLFEKRLKANLYRTFGAEWRKKAFLNPQGDPSEINGEAQLIDDVYHIPMKMELENGYYTQKAITFDTFLKMDFDIVVVSYCGNERLLHDLVRRHKPNTVFIRWIGNIHEKPLGYAKNILLAQRTPMPPRFNYITYHPEHYEGYCYAPPTNHKVIKNFIDLASYPDELQTWNKCEKLLPDFTFKMHGPTHERARNGFIPHLAMPQTMKDSAFVWHVKPHGGGGFVVRQALACGRPCIIKKSYAVIHNELAKNLFVDSVNCIDLDLGVERGIEIIREWSQPDRHVEVCKTTAEKFKKDVNFADEAESIKKWINNLLRR